MVRETLDCIKEVSVGGIGIGGKIEGIGTVIWDRVNGKIEGIGTVIWDRVIRSKRSNSLLLLSSSKPCSGEKMEI